MLISILVSLHFLFDWILQPRNVAKTKKENLTNLFFHIFCNIVPFLLILMLILVYLKYSLTSIILILLVNLSSHYFIDRLLPSGKTEREIINWTAIDQILHLSILILSLKL